MQIGKIIVIEPTDTVILKANYCMRKEEIEKEELYFREHWKMNVKIIDGSYEIAGVETNG